MFNTLIIFPYLIYCYSTILFLCALFLDQSIEDAIYTSLISSISLMIVLRFAPTCSRWGGVLVGIPIHAFTAIYILDKYFKNSEIFFVVGFVLAALVLGSYAAYFLQAMIAKWIDRKSMSGAGE